MLPGQIRQSDSGILEPEESKKQFFRQRKMMLFPEYHAKVHKDVNAKQPAVGNQFPNLFHRAVKSDSKLFQPVSGPYGGTVRSIALNSFNNWLFIATDGEVYRSKDNGSHWDMNLFPSQLHNYVEPVTILGPNVVVAETDFSNFISRDGGDSWNYLSNDVQGFAIDTTGVIYAGSNLGGVKISTDTAKTWLPFALPGKKIWKVVLCEEGKFACPSDSGIFYSKDNGTTWLFRPYDTQFTWNLVCDKKGHLFVLKYFGQDFQLFRSNDFGESWQHIILPVSGDAYRIYVEKNGRLLVPVGKYILISTDAGETWEKLKFSALTVGRDAAGNLLAGSFEGIFRHDSTNGQWYDINNGVHARRIETIEFTTSGSMLVLSLGNCFRSTDFGNSWSMIQFDVSTFINAYAPIFATSQGSIFMEASFDNHSEAGLLRSLDDGVTWERISVLSNYYVINGITEGASGDIVVTTSHGDIYRSVDDGDSWDKVFSTANHTEITCLAADKIGNYFAATDNSILISQNGESWEVVPLNRNRAA